jgi:hypothetical protein
MGAIFPTFLFLYIYKKVYIFIWEKRQKVKKLGIENLQVSENPYIKRYAEQLKISRPATKPVVFEEIKDTFQRSVRINEIAALDKKELETFLNEAKAIYNNEIVPRLGLKNKPDLTIKPESSSGELAGGNKFLTNEILVCSDILTNPDYVKVYGIKDGATIHLFDGIKREPTVSNINELNRNKAEIIQSTGITKFEFKPLTKEERKKLFLQRLYHESRHSWQNELMVQTEGIGIKKLIELDIEKLKEKRGNAGIKGFLNKSTELIASASWKPIKPYENIISRDSEPGKMAYEFFNAQKQYDLNDTNGNGYGNNSLETDAYREAYNFIKEKFGGW